jgi:site-specific recombinase XerD
MLLVQPFQTGPHLPKDVPVAHLRHLLEEIECEIAAPYASRQRMGVMDRAWVHLMLFSGLRTCEVRRLRLGEVNWAGRRIRIEQSKGLKDRLVYLNPATIAALQAWLTVRGADESQNDHVFLYRHQPLSRRYCHVRLRTYAKRTGVRITPHQLRHSCATLLLNAGAPVVTVQTLLGHEKIDTTLGYARLYDGLVAADYYRAMSQVERLLACPESLQPAPPNPSKLLALVDALGAGTLNDGQRETLCTLRVGILALAEQEISPI